MLASIISTYQLPSNLAKTTEELVLPAIVKHTAFKSAKEFVQALYTDEEQTPVWFSTRSGDLVPTIYTLWRAPFILRKVYTHPHVIDVLINGADLMLPGCLPMFDGIHEGDIVGVCDTKHPDRAMAVGRAILDLSKVEKCVGTTGVAVKILHRLEDVICMVSKKKHEVPDGVEAVIEYKVEETQEKEGIDHVQETKAKEVNTTQAEKEVDDHSQGDDDPDGQDQLTTEDIDHFFKRSLLQTLTQSPITTVTVNSSNFMDSIVKNLAIDHPQIQIKKTSWKKSAKFLKAMEKEGFVKLKGKGDDLVIVGSATKENNEELKNFVPYKIKKRAVAPKSKDTGIQSLVLTKHYQGKSLVRPVFNSLDLDFTKFYTANELRDVLNNYIEKEGLVNEKNKTTILVNDTLSHIIPGKETAIGRDKVFAPFLQRFGEFYTLGKPDGKTGKLLKGSPPTVNILTETKIGRKTVTRVFNFQSYDIDAEELSAELRLKCSGSSTIQPNVQNPKVTEVIVQGAHSAKVIELLTKKYGLHVSWIHSDDKTKKKKKK